MGISLVYIGKIYIDLTAILKSLSDFIERSLSGRGFNYSCKSYKDKLLENKIP